MTGFLITLTQFETLQLMSFTLFIIGERNVLLIKKKTNPTT